MKLSCALVLTLTNFVIATPFSFSVKGSGASAKAGTATAPFGIFGVAQPVASNAGYTGSFSKSSSLSSASGGSALSPGSFSYNSAQDNRAPWPGSGTSFTTQAQAVGQDVLTFPQVNKNSITSFSDTSVAATTGANGQTEITGSYPSENSNDLYVNNSGASKLQYQRAPETQEKNPSSTLGVSSLTSETYENSKPSTLDFPTILKVPEQSDNFKETSKVQNASNQIVTSGSAYRTSFPNTAVGNIVPQTTVASSENYQIGEQKLNYNGGFGGPPGILKPFDIGSNVKSNDTVNAFLTNKPNVQLSAPVTTKPQGFNNSPENTIKLSYVYTNKGSTDTKKPTDQSLSSGSSNFNVDTLYKPEINPTYTFQIKPTFANNVGKQSSVLKPNEDQLNTLQNFDKITQTSDGTLTQLFDGSSKPQFSSQIPSKFNKPTIDAFSQSKPINEVEVSVQAYPSTDANSSSNYNVNYEKTNVGNESSEKLSNKPTKQSLYAGGFGAPTGVQSPPSSTFTSAPVTSEVYNTSKSYLGFTVTSQKETINTGGSSNILSTSQQPSVGSTNYNTTSDTHISSTSTTDKSDYVTTKVQSETNQPSNKPSQISSFNLTYQKNPSLFNVASSGVQSSTHSSNSYPVKPQSQYPEKQVFEFGSQKKPFFSNSFGTSVTPKPSSYLGSTAYTSFSSLGYGNSGVSESLDKSKPASQFTSTYQYKPSFTNSFGGQSGVLKPSNQLTQTSSAFISSNQPTNYKPFVTSSPLSTAKPNEEISVTDQNDSSIVNDYETVSSLSQQSKQPSIVGTNYYTSPVPFILSQSPSSGSNVEQHKDASGSAISSTSETDKKNNVTATVQTETNQPSNKPSQISSFNLTYQKNPSLFNVAPTGVQSSTLSSNSYPVKPQSQFPEQQVSELGSQKKPFFSNSSGTFVTTKPISYPGSTPYTSFSSLGYGNSGVSESLDKSKPASQFTSTYQYKPSFTNSFGGQSEVLKPSNQLTQTSSAFISSNQPTNYKPFVTSSPLNTAKPNEEISVTDQNDSSIVNDYETVSSLSQQSKQPSIVGTNYYTSPVPFISSQSPSSGSNVEQHKDASGSAISSTSETDKKNNVTATVQTETNQPSNKPSQSSSFNLTYQKNPSLFNVAPTGVQSSTLSSNSYPVKPQSQFPEQQVSELGSQKKPFFSNSSGTFVTPKPISYPGSTPYTSFSSLGYGNSGVSESLDKSKPASQFTSTYQYKPSFTNSFGGQSGVLKPSNQLTQTSSAFISSNQPTNYKPFVTSSPLNTAKPNEQISVTDQNDSSIVNDYETVSSLSQQSKQPSIDGTNYYTSPVPFISSKLPSSENNVEKQKDTSGSAISKTTKTDKSDNVTTTVQSESNQPSNKPPSSSFNLTYQKNPSLFSVASSGVQSSTLSSNSYPVKPQSQLPEQQVFEFGSQKKPSYSNSFETFTTLKPISYPGSTAYTSLSSLGYGNSGVSGSLDKSKPTSQFTSTQQYKPSFTNSFGGQSGVLKPSNQLTQTSSTFISSNKPTNYKPFVTPSPLNTAKPNEEITVAGEKFFSTGNVNGTGSSLSQPSSYTASQNPSVVSTNYNTTPAPFISSTSKTDKSDYVTTAVLSETNQPSIKPSQNSSFNLTYQKNPSLFNVSSSEVKSSTLSSNSYPVKPQSQYPEKQVFEFGSQKKPFFSNSFGTFVTPKPSSQFTSTNQYTPSFTNNFGGQSGVLKPSNQPTQTSSTFISSNKPTNYKPFVTPSPLNTAKPNKEISVTDQKNSSIFKDFGTASNLPQQSSSNKISSTSFVTLKPTHSVNTAGQSISSTTAGLTVSFGSESKFSESSEPTTSKTSSLSEGYTVSTEELNSGKNSDNIPLTSKPFASPAPLNTSQQTITSQKESELNIYNLESVTGFSEPTKPPSYNGYQVNSSGVTPKPSDSGSFPIKTYTGTTSSSTAYTQQFPYKPLSGSSLGTSSVSRYSDKQKVEEKEKTGVYNTQKNTSVSLEEEKPINQTSSFPTTGSAFISSSSQNKPQNQYPAKPIFQQTTQTQPWYSNSYQSFGAVKPFSYSYPGFYSSNFGHSSSIVTGPFDKPNQNSQYSSTWQYKPSYNWGQQKPSNQPTPYVPTTFKPFTSFDRSKLSSTVSVTSQKQPSFAGGFGSSYSISKPTNQQFIDESAYLTGNAKVSSTSPLVQKPNDFNSVSQTSNKPFSVSPSTGGYSYSPNVIPMFVSTTSKYEIQKPTSQTFSNEATLSVSLGEQTSKLSTQKPTAALVPSSERFEENYGNPKPTSQSLNYFNRPIDLRAPIFENKVITNKPTTDISQKNEFISSYSETLNTNSTALSNSQFAPGYKVSSQEPISQLSLNGVGYENSVGLSSDSKHQLLHTNLTADTPKKSEYSSSLVRPYEESKPPKPLVGDVSYPSTLPAFEFNADIASGSTDKLKPFKQVSTTASNQYKPYEKPGYFDSAKHSYEVTTNQKQSISVVPNGNQHSSDNFQSMTTGTSSSTASEFPKTSNLDYGAQGNNDTKHSNAPDKVILTSQSKQSSYKPTYSTSVVSGFSNEQKVSPTIGSATQTNHVYPDSTESAIYVPSKLSSQQFSGNSALFNIQQDAFHLSKPNIQNLVIGHPSSTTVQLPCTGGFGGPEGILKPNEFSAPINYINIPSQYKPSNYNQALPTLHREPNLASYSGGFGGSSGVLKSVKNEKYPSAGNAVNDNKYFSIVHNSRLQGTLTENHGHSNYNLIPNKSSTEAQSNFEELNLGSKTTEEAQSGVVNQASVAATEATGEFINHSHNVQNLENPLNNGANSGIGFELPKNNKAINYPISGLKISRLTPTNQGSTETGISSNGLKSLAPGSSTAQGSSGFTAKSVFGRK